jgi:NADH-quinone oxidoreductase subunit E
VDVNLGMPESTVVPEGIPPLTDQTRAEAREIIARYPRSRSALLPMLHLVQSVQGYVSPQGIALCAEELGLTKAEVGAVATFYTMYRRKPAGTYHVGVCTNTLCAVMGGDAIFAAVKEHLGIGHNETLADGSVSLEHLECNAACDYAPVMMVHLQGGQPRARRLQRRPRRRGRHRRAAEPGRSRAREATRRRGSGVPRSGGLT